LSVLKRCIHSIINRSPPQLLHEIILINDASTYENLGENLENYVKSEFFENKIKFHKNEKREGLIRARMIGARLAEAEVIIFLDSHMEVTTTWLPPLLEPIVEDPTTATVPITKGMNAKTFEFDFVGPGTR
jgi:polypeptide N-acetylgalactosaminyltransferase